MCAITMLFVLITSEAMNVTVLKVLPDLVSLLEVVPLAAIHLTVHINWQMDALMMMNVSLEHMLVLKIGTGSKFEIGKTLVWCIVYVAYSLREFWNL